jgi:hypothetical protein
MRFALLFLALCLLLVACRDHQAPPEPQSDALVPIASDAELGKLLPGTWILEKPRFRSVTTLASNGSYVSHITTTWSNETRTLNLEGTWQVKNGLLIDTITKHSDPTVGVPWTFSQWIYRADDRELAVGAGNVFRKEGK